MSNYENDNSGNENRRENDNWDGNGHENRDGNRDSLKNKAEFDFDLCGKKHAVVNEAELEKIKVELKQDQSCDFCVKGDDIEYRITIENDSGKDLHDCVFKDELPCDSEFIRNSFKVNGKREDPEVKNGNLFYRIRELKKHEKIVITFEVKIK